MKKILVFLLALVMILSNVTFVSAATTYDDGQLKYNLKENFKAAVTGFSAKVPSKNFDVYGERTYLEVPATINVNGDIYTVNEIARAAFKYSSTAINGSSSNLIEVVDLSNSAINIIETYAFQGQHGLIEVKMPKKVSYYGASIFDQCTRLHKINIPAETDGLKADFFNNVGSDQWTRDKKTIITFECANTNIPNNAMDMSKALKYEFRVYTKEMVTVLNTFLTNVNADPSKYEIVKYEKSTDKTYSDGTLAYSYNIKSGIGEDGENYNNYSGATITGFASEFERHKEPEYAIDLVIPAQIPDGKEYVDVVSLNNWVFYSDDYKNDLKTVTVEGNKLAAVAKRAFSGQKALEKVVLPSSVASIGESAFDGCMSLNEINIPSGVTSVGDYAFRNVAFYGSKNPLIKFEGETVSISDKSFSSDKAFKFVTYSSDIKAVLDANVKQSYEVVHGMMFVDDAIKFKNSSNFAGYNLLVAGYNDNMLVECVKAPEDAVTDNTSLNFDLSETQILSSDCNLIKAFLIDLDTLKPYTMSLTVNK